jgi:poly-gamma-glutamate capsule biosynthesis protein CapA/YwtB (metallophosphatase superfamily)
MRRILLYTLLTFFLLVCAAFLFKINITHTDNVISPVEESIEIKSYLIPVSSFHYYPNSITENDLLTKKLIALARSKEILDNILPEIDITYVNQEDVKNMINEGAFALLDPQAVTPDLKSLALNEQFFWSKDFDTDNTYPLAFSKSIPKSQLKSSDLTEHNKKQMFFTGEIIPARAVDRLALNKNNNYTYMFDFFKDELKEADVSIGLLENPLSGDPAPCTGCMSFVGDARNAQGLAEVGFDILSLAGNHAGDGGQSAFAATISNLDDQNILHTGVGNSDDAKLQPAIIDLDGWRIGMVSADTVASYYWNQGTNYYGTNWFSEKSNSGIDLERVQKLAQLKEDNNIDYLVAYMSWGIEYTNKASSFQQDLAHALIENGVDLIVGSHPHWVQNIEFYDETPIIYSLGNFLFDQNHTDPTRQAMNVMLYYYDNELKSIELIPHLACGPFISSRNITDDYLAGKITIQDLLNNNEKNGCVYFQPLKLDQDNTNYKAILDRVMQYSNFTY